MIPDQLLSRIQKALAADHDLTIDGWYEYDDDQMLFLIDDVSNARYRIDLSLVEKQG